MRLRAGFAAVVAVLAAAGSASAATKSAESSEARSSLAQATSLFDGQPVADRDATMILRDLALRLDLLGPAERAEARAILARPDDKADGGDEPRYTVAPAPPACSEHFCVHYVTSTADAPPLADADGNGLPDQVDLTLSVLEHVWAKEIVEFGFRPPKPDDTSKNHGPDGKLDVYLADLGADGLYGYCTTDDPDVATTPSGPWDGSAYCALDNDFAASQFSGAASGVEALEVTAAHEFFHAVQFAYDIGEDRWFMEATAVWMEDQVYDEVDDNYQYLESSQLKRPGIPLDLGLSDSSDPVSSFQYGAFVFFRYVTESLADPLVIRRMWEFADGKAGGPDQYSLKAIDSALRENGTNFRAAFAHFGAVNVVPGAFYEEGAAYPTPNARRTTTVPASTPLKGKGKLNHLTTWYARFQPAADAGPGTRLRLKLDLPPRARGSEASVVVIDAAGTPTIVPVTLTSAGDGTVMVPFAAGEVQAVQLVVSNASARFRCGAGTYFSCNGRPLDDGLTFLYQATVLPAASR